MSEVKFDADLERTVLSFDMDLERALLDKSIRNFHAAIALLKYAENRVQEVRARRKALTAAESVTACWKRIAAFTTQAHHEYEQATAALRAQVEEERSEVP